MVPGCVRLLSAQLLDVAAMCGVDVVVGVVEGGLDGRERIEWGGGLGGGVEERGVFFCVGDVLEGRVSIANRVLIDDVERSGGGGVEGGKVVVRLAVPVGGECEAAEVGVELYSCAEGVRHCDGGRGKIPDGSRGRGGLGWDAFDAG